MDYKKLYIKSLIVTLVLIFIGAAIISPRLGLAQGGATNVDQGSDLSAEPAAGEPALRTDHPEGKLFDVIVEDQIATTNLRDGDLSLQGEEVTSPSLEQNNLDDRSETSTQDIVVLKGIEAERDLITTENRALQPLVIPAADFRSDGNNPDGYFFTFYGGRLQKKSGDTLWSCMMSPVYLQDGVTIRQFWASAIDNAAADTIWLTLYLVDNYTGDSVNIATIQPTGEDPDIVSFGTVNLNSLVEYPEYSYYVGTCFVGQTIRLYSVRVWYDQ